MLLTAQNITDLAVMNDRSADGPALQEGVVPSTVDDSLFVYPDRIRFDNQCIQIEGKDVFVMSGAFHYFRVPQPLWRDRMEKLKSAGMNCVETYIPWNWHERLAPRTPNDYSQLEMSQLEAFLQLAEQAGLYVIVRPGPYICAEWSGGGFPQWLMSKKPVATAREAWLQSDDPEFMRWNEHWYKAVCRVVAPHQLTRRGKGETGVILFQVENEFNRVKWFPSEAKRDYIEQLIRIARREGIDVPVVTCWTTEARNVMQGPLNGVVDMVNSYPRWEIERNFGRLINQQLKSQPGKPLISGELQGGWMSEVGGLLSEEQEGLLPVQTQNITLYALQRGFCGINYYMAVGGTNGDDWGARQMTTTYDYAAAIGEDGSTGERFRRLQGLSQLLREHGTRIARSQAIPLDYTSTDPEVTLALRQAANGDRYFFVRTEEHTRQHCGTLQTADLTLDFSLEAFGSMLYYLPYNASEGQWLPRIPEPQTRPTVEADTIHLAFDTLADALPTHWKRLGRGQHINDRGIYGHHLIYYRTQAPEGRQLEVGRIGDKLINGTEGDEVLVSVGGALSPMVKADAHTACYQLPGDSTSSRNVEVILLFESKGLHHHTTKEVEDHWGIGIDYVRCEGKDLPLQFAYTEADRGLALSRGEKSGNWDGRSIGSSLLTWHICSFQMPEQPEGVTFPWNLRLAHTGNGFIYLNGHCLGRCWDKGPQWEYYLPPCWLNFGEENHLAISLRPTEKRTGIDKADIVPATWKAELKQ